MRESQIILQNEKKKKKKDKVIIMLAATLDFTGLTTVLYLPLLQAFFLPLGLCEDILRSHSEMSRVKADDLAPDIFKTQIKSQEILDLLILVLEVAKVWLHHITCHWHDGNCEKKI